MASSARQILRRYEQLMESQRFARGSAQASAENVDVNWPWKIDGRNVSENEYYEELGAFIEAHPINSPRRR